MAPQASVSQQRSKAPGYDIKPWNGEAPALEIWVIWSTPTLPLVPCPLRPGVRASYWILSQGQIEQTVCKQMTNVKLWLFYCNTWKPFNCVQKKSLDSFNNVIYKMSLSIIHIYIYIYIYIYIQDLSLNSWQWLIRHQTKQNQTKLIPLDSPKYSSPFWQCCGLDGIDSFSEFQLFQSFFITFSDCSKCSIYN